MALPKLKPQPPTLVLVDSPSGTEPSPRVPDTPPWKRTPKGKEDLYAILAEIDRMIPWPDHTQLPDRDGTVVKNFQEHPQSILLTDSLAPILRRLHPDGHYAIGQDCGIYYKAKRPDGTEYTRVECPDWYYVPNVPPKFEGRVRRSYVMWKENGIPAVAIEFVSGDGKEERDMTPQTGKFWVYEHELHIAYYAIFEEEKTNLEVYALQNEKYQLMPKNAQGRYDIPPLGVELGLWRGTYQNMEVTWIRWWDKDGTMLLSGEERAARERQRANLALSNMERERQEKERALSDMERERQRADLALSNMERERQEKEQALSDMERERQEKERERQEKEQALSDMERERQEKERERQEKERERQRAERLAARLRELGVNLEE